MDRREFLKLGCLATASLFLPESAFSMEYERVLKMYHRHTGEEITATFWIDGEYVYEELESLDFFLRDYRTDEVCRMDRNLIEYLYQIQRLSGGKEIHVLSAYRTIQTNNMLRKHNRGVAKHSYHTKGKAVDITIPGVSTASLKRIALSLKRGGVGYYPKSHFIHIDTGRPRYWRFPRYRRRR
ncbi:MAG: YcbK family protein [Epsilonproteobacteria bacterium]|nr:YcbK family protein [Campylobacterota bacterium]